MHAWVVTKSYGYEGPSIVIGTLAQIFGKWDKSGQSTDGSWSWSGHPSNLGA